jgi:hypothetical protein
MSVANFFSSSREAKRLRLDRSIIHHTVTNFKEDGISGNRYRRCVLCMNRANCWMQSYTVCQMDKGK